MNCQDTLERLSAAESSSLPVMAVAMASATVEVSIHDIDSEDIIFKYQMKVPECTCQTFEAAHMEPKEGG